MAFVGGDALEITWNHPELGDGVFYLKGGEDVSIDLGGFRTEDEAGAVAGNGQMITKLNRKRWMIEGPIAWDMSIGSEIEKLDDLAGSPVEAQFTVSHINGTVYQGKGTVVGDIQGSMQDSTIPLKLSGGGKLSKQG